MLDRQEKKVDAIVTLKQVYQTHLLVYSVAAVKEPQQCLVKNSDNQYNFYRKKFTLFQVQHHSKTDKIVRDGQKSEGHEA